MCLGLRARDMGYVLAVACDQHMAQEVSLHSRSRLEQRVIKGSSLVPAQGWVLHYPGTNWPGRGLRMKRSHM